MTPPPLWLHHFPGPRTLAQSMLGARWIEHLVADLRRWLAELDETARLSELTWLGPPTIATRVDSYGRLTAQQLALELEPVVVDGQGQRHLLRVQMSYDGSALTTLEPSVSWEVEVISHQREPSPRADTMP